MKICIRWALTLGALLWLAVPTRSQSLGNSGTIEDAVVDQCGPSLVLMIPAICRGSDLIPAIVYTFGGVAVDPTGFFHPLGEHAQGSFVIEGQPVTDQQCSIFSNQLPSGAVHSVELNTGNPGAEFGDKTSLVAQVTRSTAGHGSFDPSDSQTELTADGEQRGSTIWGQIAGATSMLQDRLNVELIGQDNPFKQQVRVSTTGNFEFREVPAGDYQFRVIDRSGVVVHEQTQSHGGTTEFVFVVIRDVESEQAARNTISFTALQHHTPDRA